MVTGHTYTFDTPLQTGAGLGVRTHQTVTMTVDGQQLWTGDTMGNLDTGGVGLVDGSADYTLSGTYKAPITGPVTMQYTLSLPARGADINGANDDIRVQLPTISCSEAR